MKVLFIFVTLISIITAKPLTSKSSTPECRKDQLQKLWPDPESKEHYYQCIAVGEFYRLQCGSKKWFDFNKQTCVNPDEWAPPVTTDSPTDPTETYPTETDPTETDPTETDPTETNPTVPTEPQPTKEDTDSTTENPKTTTSGPITEGTPTPPTAPTRTTSNETIPTTTQSTGNPSRPTPPTPIPTAPTDSPLLKIQNEIKRSFRKLIKTVLSNTD